MRERGFIDPPDASPGDDGALASPGFIDPLEQPRWIVTTPAIPGLPDVVALLAALEHLQIGGEP